MNGMMLRLRRRLVVSGLLSVVVPATVALTALPASAAGGAATVTVDADGSYSVDVPSPAYHFAGSVGATVSNVTTVTGQDAVGAYHETDFDYTVGGVDRSSGIRTYDSTQIVLFSTTYKQAGANANPFPALSQRPTLPGREHFKDCWAGPKINVAGDAGTSPYLAFDGSGGYLLSAANNLTTGTVRFENSALVSGVTTGITSLPAGFTYKTILSYGSSINGVYDVWGKALTSWGGKTRPAQDATPTLAKLGYWTDNGATYYYKYDTALGYQGTLQAVQNDWKSKGLPMGNLQLDSWWYPKGATAAAAAWNGTGGQYLYQADSTLFPNGLSAFQKSVNVPLITHSRWIDAGSPYRQQYQMSGGVSTDPAYWNDRMSYLKSSGVATYEQDWLCLNAQPDLNLTDREAFLGNMAAAAKANGMDIQYCMAMPQDFLESTKHDAVTNIRTSWDRFDRSKWDQFLYSSRLASAVGLWPFADTMMSTETRNLLLSNLSAGPVGVGDPIGTESVENLKKVAQADGTIVKPDTPIVPNDASYVRDIAATSGPMVATTGSRHGAMNAGYVYAYARPATPDTVYEAEDATLSGPVVATDHTGYTGTGFVHYQHNTGDYIQWNVNAPTAGTYTLLFRYANGDFNKRPMSASVDGGTATTLPFIPTTNGDTWSQQPLVVNLSAGAHTVRLSAAGGTPDNIDNLGIAAGDKTIQDAPFKAADFGITGNAYVYDYFADSGTVVDANSTYTGRVNGDGTYYQVVPVGASGIAFLGDAGKFVSLGKQRISALSDDGTVRATVKFAAGDEPVTVHGYSPMAVTSAATGGTVDQVTYNATTHLFSARVTPAAGATSVNLTVALRPDTTYEAEAAQVTGAVVAGDHTGYTGTGFVDYQNNTDDSIQWSINAPAAGSYTLMFRYANGGSTNRTLGVSVDGGTATNQPFAPTGSFDTWMVQPVTVNLTAGAHTVKTTVTGVPGPNVDNLGVSAADPTTYEAEVATVSGAKVTTDHTGYTGSGFVDYQNNTGEYIQWNVNAPAAGSYTLMFRYANGGTANRPLAVAVDGGTATNQPFAPTANWDTWAVQPVTVNLTAGTHTVRLAVTGTPGPNVDNLSIGTSSAATLEAEVATVSGAKVTTDHTGYSGSGFVDYQNNTGEYIQWNVNAPAAGSYTLMFRYANGGTANRPLAVAVDGGTATNQPFAPTANWDTWAVQPVTVNLTAGTHTVRLAVTGTPGPNVDNLGVLAGG